MDDPYDGSQLVIRFIGYTGGRRLTPTKARAAPDQLRPPG
jgi:hypothetical protein